MKQIQYGFFVLLFFLNSPISAQTSYGLIEPWEDVVKSQHITFGQLKVNESYLVIW